MKPQLLYLGRLVAVLWPVRTCYTSEGTYAIGS